jgi:hypothetical protein
MARDVCQACGRVIFTTSLRSNVISLAMRWTHGGYGIVDRNHAPIPSQHRYRVVRNR